MRLQSIVVMATLLGLPAVAVAQVATTGTLSTATSLNTGGCPSDKLQLMGFTVTPGNPLVNQNVTIRITLRNSCTGTSLNIPYKITNYTTTVASGTKSVPANGTTNVDVVWKATAGNHVFDALLDETNTLNESSTNRVNNGASDGIALSVAPFVTMTLDAQAASSAGAHHAHAFKSSVCDMASRMGSIMIQFVANYVGLPASKFRVRGPVICTMVTEGEAFGNLQLKNGWRVKSASGNHEGSGANWQWITQPSAGSTNPFAKIRITSNPGAVDYTVNLKIEIEGPQGTNPYQ